MFSLCATLRNVATLIAGASSSEVYEEIKRKSLDTFEKAMEALTNGDSTAEINVDLNNLSSLAKWFWIKFYMVYVPVKEIFPIAIGLTLALGILLLIIFRKNKMIRKTAISTFILGIPFILFIIVYCIPAFAAPFT